MNNTLFKPMIYLKAGCPFCFKVRLFLSEAGLLDKVVLREFTPGTDEEQEIRDELAPHFEKVSIPAAQIARGRYISDSDVTIGELAENFGVDPERLPTLKAYKSGLFKRYVELFRENKELKQQALR